MLKLFRKGIMLIIVFGLIYICNNTEILASESITENSKTIYYNAYIQALQDAEETNFLHLSQSVLKI